MNNSCDNEVKEIKKMESVKILPRKIVMKEITHILGIFLSTDGVFPIYQIFYRLQLCEFFFYICTSYILYVIIHFYVVLLMLEEIYAISGMMFRLEVIHG